MLKKILNFTLFSLCFVTAFANDECANAIVLTPNSTCVNTSATFSGATLNGSAPTCASNSSQDIWFKFTATDPTMRVTLSSTSGLNHGFEIIQGSCGGTVMSCTNESGAGWSENKIANNFLVGQEYFIRVFNASATTSSASFNICLRNYPSPINDACSNAIELTPTLTCGNIATSFSGALLESGATTPSCGPSISQDIWFKFTATDPTMGISLTSDSDLDHGFEIIQGTCGGGTIKYCKNGSGLGWSESYMDNDFIPGQEYLVRVFNAYGNIVTNNFNICVRKYPRPVNDECSNAIELTPSLTCGNIATSFSGALLESGATTPSCGVNISQDIWFKFTATDQTMSINLISESGLDHGFEIIQASCGGTVQYCKNGSGLGWSESYMNNDFIPGQLYYIRVFNASSTITTINFNICLKKYPSPTNDACSNAIELTPNTTCTNTLGSFSGAMLNGPTPSCPTYAVQDLWYKFTATDSIMRVSVAASGTTYLDPAIQIFENSCSGPLFICQNTSTGSSESYYNNNFVPGKVYFVRVLNASTSLETYNFNICIVKYPKPINDDCANARVLTPNSTCSNTSGTFSGAMLNGPTPTCASFAIQDVWYSFTATATTMNVNVAAVGTTYLNPAIQIFENSCNGNVLACQNSSSSSSENFSGTNFVIGNTYYIRVLSASTELNSYNFNICVVGPPPASCTPSVSISSTATTICQGESVTFTATPTNGGVTPSYQWKSNGSNVGTNSATYTSNTLTNGSSITCVMTSNAPCASPTTATSNAISITVNASITPTISITSNQGTEFCQGQQVIYTATITNGGTNPTYQWKRNGSNVGTGLTTYTSNSNNNGDVITCVLMSDVACGDPSTVISNSLTLTVNSNVIPTVTISSNQGTEICQGQQVIYSATNTNGGTNPTYQWKRNGSNVGTGLATYTSSANNNGDVITCILTSNSPCANTSPVTSNSLTMLVNTSITPTISITSNQGSTICQGQQIVFSSTITGGGSTPVYQWKRNGSNVGTGLSTYTSTANNNGDVITCVLTSNSSCASSTPITSNSLTITVNSPITPTFNAIAPICSGSNFTLLNSSTNGINGTWSPAVDNTTTTTYTFTPNTGQCASNTSMTVTVNSVNTSTSVSGNTISSSASNTSSFQWINCTTSLPISGATSSSFTPVENGQYAVIVTENNCSDTSACTTINSLSIKDLDTKIHPNLYPNPFTETIILESGVEFIGMNYKISNIAGNTIQEGIILEKTETFELSNLSTGIYFITLSDYTIKFVKQ